MTWRILEKTTHKKRKQLKVQCDCGAIEIRRKDHIISGRTKSCKKCSCANTLKKHPNKVFGPRPHQGVGDISKTYWISIKFGAKKRDLTFAVSMQYVWDLFLKQNKKCALSGVSLELKHGYKNSNVNWSTITASLDRIDPSIGYIEGNVQWVHKIVNYIKRDLSEKDFIDWCKKIAVHKGDKCGD